MMTIEIPLRYLHIFISVIKRIHSNFNVESWKLCFKIYDDMEMYEIKV